MKGRLKGGGVHYTNTHPTLLCKTRPIPPRLPNPLFCPPQRVGNDTGRSPWNQQHPRPPENALRQKTPPRLPPSRAARVSPTQPLLPYLILPPTTSTPIWILRASPTSSNRPFFQSHINTIHPSRTRTPKMPSLPRFLGSKPSRSCVTCP